MSDTKTTAKIMAKKDTDSLTPDEKSALNSALMKMAAKIGIPVALAASITTGGVSWFGTQDIATKSDVEEILEKIDQGDAERAAMDLRLRAIEREVDKREFRLKALENKRD